MTKLIDTFDGDDAAMSDEAFCDAVWKALKGDHNDLRKQQIILKAHREALATPPHRQEVEEG